MEWAIHGVLLLAGIVLVAGVVNGIAGFGLAVIGTMALASILPPATAVVIMILPILAVNILLLDELSYSDLRLCGRRFWPLIVSALIGTIVGMTFLDRIPEALLRIGLGLIALGFVLSTQNVISFKVFEQARDRCFVENRPAMVGIGAISGVIFGGTNVGVQLVAYLRSCDLRHELFIGVVAMVFVGINAVRVGIAIVIGLYSSWDIAILSVITMISAVIGVLLGKALQKKSSERIQHTLVIGLLIIIGTRLILDGTGIL